MTNYLYSAASAAASASASAWMAVATDEQLVVVNSQDPVLLSQLWSEANNGMHAAVGVLTARGIAATPAFALVSWSISSEQEVSTRVIVRGAVEVAITTASGVINLSGTKVSTWSEHNVEDARSCDVSMDAASEDCTLPLVAGVVPVQRVRCSFDASTSSSSSLPGSAPTSSGSPTQAANSGSVAVQTPLSEATIVDRRGSEPGTAIGGVPTAVVAGDNKISSSTRDPDGPDSPGGPGGPGGTSNETVHRQVPDPVVAEVADDQLESGAEMGSTGDAAGDHDGMTIMTGELRKLRADRGAKRAAAQTGLVSAVTASVALYLELSTGSREALTQPILVGRAPSVSKVSGGALPRLVTIPGDKDISRNHVQLVVEGGTVVVTDLHSRNGTQVILPGKKPQRLRAGEPTAVIVGTVVDLGGEVTLTVCEEP